MMNFENLIWAVAAATVTAVIYFSGDGFYRYPCQDPANWSSPECQPPICLRTKNCASDLTGASE
jgi:hypothetical protein